MGINSGLKKKGHKSWLQIQIHVPLVMMCAHSWTSWNKIHFYSNRNTFLCFEHRNGKYLAYYDLLLSYFLQNSLRKKTKPLKTYKGKIQVKWISLRVYNRVFKYCFLVVVADNNLFILTKWNKRNKIGKNAFTWLSSSY